MLGIVALSRGASGSTGDHGTPRDSGQIDALRERAQGALLPNGSVGRPGTRPRTAAGSQQHSGQSSADAAVTHQVLRLASRIVTSVRVRQRDARFNDTIGEDAAFREKPDHVRQVVRERGYVAPVLLDESGDVTGKTYGVWGPPTAYFIDREGRLIGRVAGPRDWSGPAAQTFVQALLDGR
jgi:hypothetical protein